MATGGGHPLIVSAWGSDVLGWNEKWRLSQYAAKFALGRASIVCATSAHLANAVTRVSGRTAVVTPFGVDLDHFQWQPDPPSPPFVIGAARNLSSNYGIDVLIAALPEVIKAVPGTRLLLAGDGPARTQLQRQVDALDLGDQVEFLGRVRHEDMPAFYSKVHVVVMPTTGHEAYGVAALEAAAVGRPVVASLLGGLPEVIRHNETGLMVPPSHPAKLASAIIALARAPDKRRRMGRAGREMVVGSFSIKSTTNNFIDLYRNTT